MTCLIVNGEKIEGERIRAETAAVAKVLAERLPEEDPLEQRMKAREWAEENLIEEVLLRQASAADPKAVEKIVSRVGRPQRSEVLAVYRSNESIFHSPEMVHAAHVVCNIDEQNDEATAKAKIDRVALELAGGREFSEVADELSDCPGNGGDLGTFPRGEMVESFDEVVFQLRPGAVSGIFRTEFGFHIAKVLEKKSAGTKPFESVRDEIEQHLWEERRQSALHEFVDGLRAKAEIRKVKEKEGE
jgi:parvulin-like peptidyl-prolyl isomerase